MGSLFERFTRFEEGFAPAASLMQSTQNRLRIALDDPQQGLGWTFGLPSSLLPVPERLDADADHLRKVRLGQAGPLPEYLHIQIGQCGAPVREVSALHDGAHLLNAQHQLLEIFIVHGELS